MKSIQSNIKKAKKYLDKNHCVAVPTETVYGLAGNAYSNISVKKIFKLKRRPLNNPLIVHYLNINRLKEDCHINNDFIKLYNKFSPGPITYILRLKKNSKISRFVTNKPSFRSFITKNFLNISIPLKKTSSQIGRASCRERV